MRLRRKVFARNFVVEIDYANQTLTLYDPQTYNLAAAPGAIEIVNHGGSPYVRTELSLDGRNRVTDLFKIDTGSNGIFPSTARSPKSIDCCGSSREQRRRKE